MPKSAVVGLVAIVLLVAAASGHRTRTAHDHLATRVDSLAVTLQALVQSPNARAASSGPTRLEVSLSHAAAFAGAGEVTLIEFTDYECPFCRRHAREVLPGIWSDYVEAGRIRYVLMDLPLPMHSQAVAAALAARCAGEQNRYWDYHDALYEMVSLEGNWQEAIASDLELNLDRFRVCTTDADRRAKVESAQAYARNLNVQSTPTFVIARSGSGDIVEGVVLRGFNQAAAFRTAIDDALRSR